MKLHDFSEVYGIKESALRYWEKAGILSAKRMENQKYRDLSTNISRLFVSRHTLLPQKRGRRQRHDGLRQNGRRTNI